MNEEFKNMRQGIVVDSNAVIRHFDGNRLIVPPRSNADVAADVGVVGRIAQKIRNDLRQTIFICVNDQAGGHVDIELVATCFEQRTHHLDGARYDLGYLHRPSLERYLAARQPGDVEQVVDQPNEMLRLALDHVELLRWLSGGARLEDVDGCHDRRERVAQLVTEQRKEVVLAFAQTPRFFFQLQSRDERTEVLPRVVAEPHVPVRVDARCGRKGDGADGSPGHLEWNAYAPRALTAGRAAFEHAMDGRYLLIGQVREHRPPQSLVLARRQPANGLVAPVVADERERASIEVDDPAKTSGHHQQKRLEVRGVGTFREQLDEDVEPPDVGER
ncbi:MAG TPA: hypothetical protein VK762_06380 [Polyangiaceae bacterium]|nr:hypothetical protein [Polyangiaceae bacterium]